MATGNRKAPKARTVKRLAWQVKMAWRNMRAWKRSKIREQRELDAFRMCAWLERKSMEYPYAVPILEELMRIYQATGQEARRIDIMRRLRDIEPKPVPDFIWDEQPPVKVYDNIVDARCAKIERFVNDRCMDFIHFNHIKNLLYVSTDDAKEVCAALINRGVLESYDVATGICRVDNIMERLRNANVS